jgi:hypothetical protein
MPTTDFVGPGTATFSLPPNSEHATPVAFYGYRITSVLASSEDKEPAIITLRKPRSGRETVKSYPYVYTLRGTVTDNVNTTKLSYRIKYNQQPYGPWQTIRLTGNAKEKQWEREIWLNTERPPHPDPDFFGVTRVQIRATDKSGNISTSTVVTITQQL